MRSRTWRLVVRVVPRRFRRRFGDDLADTIAELAHDARARGGRRAQAKYVCREGWALCRLAVETRRLRKTAHLWAATHPPTRLRSGLLPSAGRDLRWALRQARRRPVHTAAIAGTLAVTVAAITTAYGLARAVLWRPLPFRDARQLVFVWERNTDAQAMRVTAWRYGAWRDTSASFTSVALFGAAGFTMDDQQGPVSIRGVRASAGFFQTLGLAPMLGRAFTPEDEQPGRDRVVILSHALWRARFGGRADAVGSTLRLNGAPYTVVGVLPPVVAPGWPVNPATVMIDPDVRQIWVPIARTPSLEANAGSHVFGVLARLAPGVSAARAADELNRATTPNAPDSHGAIVSPLREQFVRASRLPLLLLLAAAGAVLLIACANLAALQVTAFEARRQEFEIRTAIGAGASRLLGQVLVESLTLAAAGGLLGAPVSALALARLPGLLPTSVPLLTPPRFGSDIAMFIVGTSIATALVLAAWPLTRVTFVGVAARPTGRQPRRALYRALVVAQVSITVALTVCAGLLGQSLSSVRRQDPGFIVDNVLVADVTLSPQYREGAQVAAAEQRILDAIASRPRMSAVALAYDHPLEANWSGGFQLEGRPDDTARRASPPAELRIVSPGYFDALGVEVLDGRRFTARDDLEAPGVALVNEAFARDARGAVLGQRLHGTAVRFTWGDRAPVDFTIIGVVENERFRGLEQPPLPAVYLSIGQFPQQAFSVLIRTTVDPLDLATDVRSVVRAAEPTAALDRPDSLADLLAQQLAERRVTTRVIGGFATAAIALAALGLYGLLAVLVSSRTREIGIRLALGAAPISVGLRIVMESLACASIGVVLGLLLAVVAGRRLTSLLVGVTSHDGPTLAIVSATLVLAAVAAAAAPARRAARVDPIRALRQP